MIAAIAQSVQSLCKCFSAIERRLAIIQEGNAFLLTKLHHLTFEQNILIKGFLWLILQRKLGMWSSLDDRSNAQWTREWLDSMAMGWNRKLKHPSVTPPYPFPVSSRLAFSPYSTLFAVFATKAPGPRLLPNKQPLQKVAENSSFK